MEEQLTIFFLKKIWVEPYFLKGGETPLELRFPQYVRRHEVENPILNFTKEDLPSFMNWVLRQKEIAQLVEIGHIFYEKVHLDRHFLSKDFQDIFVDHMVENTNILPGAIIIAVQLLTDDFNDQGVFDESPPFVTEYEKTKFREFMNSPELVVWVEAMAYHPETQDMADIVETITARVIDEYAYATGLRAEPSSDLVAMVEDIVIGVMMK